MNNTKLPTAFKNKWIKALRSGKYKQGDGYLNNADKYCCLGVACVVGGQKLVPTKEFIGKNNSNVPSILRGENDLTTELAMMNDKGTSFKKIAKWIEKNL